MCVFFFNFDHLRITVQSSNLIWGTKFRAPSLPLHPLIFPYLQTLIYYFLWWWASSWLIFSLKWFLQSSFFLLHSASIKLQEAKEHHLDEDALIPHDVAPYRTCRPWIFFINGVLCFLKFNGSGMEKEEKIIGDATSRRRWVKKKLTTIGSHG